MEMLIIVAIWTVVVKRGVEDIWHTARGGTPPRLAAAKQRRQSGAAGRYWGALWDDTFEDLLGRHNDRRARRTAGPSKVDRPRGAATQYFAGLFQDGRRAARRSWESGWTRLDEKRREKATCPRPGQQIVPGQVVPNARPQDETQDRPQDGTEDRPQDETTLWPEPEPTFVPREDGTTDLRFGDDPTDPNAVSTCPDCKGQGVVDGTICGSCLSRQAQRDQHHENQTAPDSGPGNQTPSPLASTTTQEGTTMTAVAAEAVGLNGVLTFSEQSAQQYRSNAVDNEATGARCTQYANAYRRQVTITEAARASSIAGGVTGEVIARFDQSIEKANSAADDMEKAAALFATGMDTANAAAIDMDAAAGRLRSHLGIQEQYNANPDAGDREFVTAGQ